MNTINIKKYVDKFLIFHEDQSNDIPDLPCTSSSLNQIRLMMNYPHNSSIHELNYLMHSRQIYNKKHKETYYR